MSVRNQKNYVKTRTERSKYKKRPTELAWTGVKRNDFQGFDFRFHSDGLCGCISLHNVCAYSNVNLGEYFVVGMYAARDQ